MAHADHHDHGDAAAAHDAHDDHHEPPPPPEPETPGWLTAVGAALFLVAGGVFLLMNVDPAAAGSKGAATTTTAAAATATATAMVRPTPAPQLVTAQPNARPLPQGINPVQIQRAPAPTH